MLELVKVLIKPFVILISYLELLEYDFLLLSSSLSGLSQRLNESLLVILYLLNFFEGLTRYI